jgi:hypothetical protein
MKKNIIVLCLLAIFVLAGCSASPIEGVKTFKELNPQLSLGGKTYNSEKELSDDSELIILGSPAKSIVDEKPNIFYLDIDANKPDGDKHIEYAFTLREINIREVLKGSYDKKTINVAETAAYVEKKGLMSESYVINFGESVLLENGEYILYISKAPENGTGLENVDYMFMLPGKFEISKGDGISQKVDNIEFKDGMSDPSKKIAKEVSDKYLNKNN